MGTNPEVIEALAGAMKAAFRVMVNYFFKTLII
jgi:hypothetical protein